MKTQLSKSNRFFDLNSVVAQYFNDIRRYPLLTKAEEDQAALAHDTDKLVNCSLRFAVCMAHAVGYYGNQEDLIQCANIGLIKAANAYDPSKMSPSGRFINFAQHYILGEMLQYRRQQSAYSREDFFLSKRIMAVSDKYQAEYGQEADSDYIAAKLAVPVSKVEEILSNDYEYVSVDANVGEEGSATYGDLIIGDYDADADLKKSDNRKSIEAEMQACLNYNEVTVMRSLFGFDSQVPKSLDDIAAELHLTPQRCSQIKNAAIAKLRDNNVLKELAGNF